MTRPSIRESVARGASSAAQQGSPLLGLVAAVGAAAVSLPPGLYPLGADVVQVAYRLLSLLAVAGSVLLVLGRRQHRLVSSPLANYLLGLSFLAAFVGGVVGLWRGNPIILIAGDAARYALCGICVMLVTRLWPSERDVLLKAFWLAFAAVEIFKAALFLNYGSQGLYVRLAGSDALATAMAVGYAPTFRNPAVKTLSVLGRVSVLFNVATSLVRTMWVVVAVQSVLLTIAALRRRDRSVIPRAALVLAAGAAAVAWTGARTEIPVRERLAQRVEQLPGAAGGQDANVASRDTEAAEAQSHARKLPLSFLGAGAGARFESSDSESDDGFRHQIHDTSVSLEVRLGLLGTTLWWMIVAAAIAALHGLLRGTVRTADAALLGAAAVGAVLASKTFYSLVGVLPAFYSVAFVAASGFRSRLSAATSLR